LALVDAMCRLFLFSLTALLAGTQADIPADDTIVWSAERKLTWNDFKARPPSGALGGARSALGFGFAFGCRENKLYAEVVARFHPDKSWVAYRIISSGLASRAGIQHEQTHFDLSEVHARRIRKFFRELKDPCPRSDAELEALAEPIFREEGAAQRRYDDQTENGQLGGPQERWDKDVARQLGELSAFSSSSASYSSAAGPMTIRVSARAPLTAPSGMVRSNVASRPPIRLAKPSR
jgi:hypothetical protein